MERTKKEKKYMPYKLFISMIITIFCISSLKIQNEKLDKFNFYLTEIINQNSSWDNLKNNSLSIYNYFQRKFSDEVYIEVSSSLIEDLKTEENKKK